MSDSADSPVHCVECGDGLPTDVSFCPDCGAEVEYTLSEEGYSQNETEQSDMIKMADKVTSKSKGMVRPEILTQLKEPKMFLSGARNEGRRMLYDKPLISYVDENETIHYILSNSSDGLKIIEPDGNKRTPHHGQRYCFLLITDRRIIYVAAHDGEDIMKDFNYSEIKRVGLNQNMVKKDKFEFHTHDGYRYRFASISKNLAKTPTTNQEPASKYIRKNFHVGWIFGIGFISDYIRNSIKKFR